MIDVGRKVVTHQVKGFLGAQTVYFLLNFNLAHRQIWITRHVGLGSPSPICITVLERLCTDYHINFRGSPRIMLRVKLEEMLHSVARGKNMLEP